MKRKSHIDAEEGYIRLGFYPYTYVRTTAMKAQLVRKEDYPKLLKMGLNEITKFLQESTYKKQINELATAYSGLDLLEIAMNRNLADSFDKLRRISSDELKQLINEYTKRNDIEDIKTIIRGKFTNAPAEKIKSLIVGAGTLSLEELRKLADMEIKDILRNNKIVEFSYLEDAYKEFTEKGSIAAIENSLDNYYYYDILEFTKKLSEGNLFRKFIETEMEIKNVVSLIRLKREKLARKEIEKYLFFFRQSGKDGKIRRLLSIDDTKELLRSLENEDYGDIIKQGTEDFEKNNSLIDIEIGLHKYLLDTTTMLMHQHPLSVEVIVGYMFAKENEVRNLRLIIKGKQLGLDEEFIEKQIVV